MKRLAISLCLLLSVAVSAALAADPDGKAIYTAKCQSCHGADGAKAMLSKPVKGMKADQVAKAMSGYKAKTFGGAKKATMENLAAKLSDAEIKAVSTYIGTL